MKKALSIERWAWSVGRLIGKIIKLSRNAQRTTHNAPIMAKLSLWPAEFARKRRLAGVR